MSVYSFDAVIFDLDGVITRTALVHSSAWKTMFDGYLHERATKYGEAFREFTQKDDYLPYVDGKPRYKGVESFLQSRGIIIPYGDPADGPEMETICGIGNRKNIAFNKILEEQGVSIYESTIKLILELKSHGIHVGVASSSKNCEAVLHAAGLLPLMETRVDGIVSDQLKLKGKPEPDIFCVASDNMGVPYDRAVVVEDAVSGVQAGRAGNFGLVIGVAREENEKELQSSGADLVVKDLEELGIGTIEDWFRKGLIRDNWTLTYHDYDPGKEKTRETLLTVGNGYFGTRGAMEESLPSGDHYPGTYMAGIYNRLVSNVAGRDVDNEDLVNCINWLPVTFSIEEGPWLDISQVEILQIRRTLHFQNGMLFRWMIIRDKQGKTTKIESRRVAGMHDPHVAALEYTVVPLDWTGKITVRSGLEGNHINDGVERYRMLNQKHLQPLVSSGQNGVNHLSVITSTSRISIYASCHHHLLLNHRELSVQFRTDADEGRSFSEFTLGVRPGDRLTVNKIVALGHSLDTALDHPQDLIRTKAALYKSFEEVLTPSEKNWEQLWDEMDIRVTGDRRAQKLLRMHLYHLLVTLSPHNVKIDAGVPARGLHGEAYRGHIFWDEIFILPLYDLHLPNVACAALMYRYRRLNAAREYARANGFRGAMFPWQSGSDGREETQVVHLNPVSGEWGPDYSALQRHVSLAIAYNTWLYYHITGDHEFMEDFGAEMIFEICRFWAEQCVFDEADDRYSISGVMGPDEFHEKYPDREDGGLKNNAYTNIMVAWMLRKAIRLMEKLPGKAIRKVREITGIDDREISRWKEIMGKLKLDISPDGIIAQYEGYFDLKELDWNYFREKYDNIYRMDRLLKAEGKSPDGYKVAKQADTLMTFYNLEREETGSLLADLGYTLPEGYLQRNLEYYLRRTSHGSTLSRVVHARLANLAGDPTLGWQLYLDALTSDYQDIQGGTTAEGIHAGVMAGTVWIALTTFGGLDLSGEIPAFDPMLPQHWRSLSFSFDFKGLSYECEVTKEILRIRVESDDHMTTIIIKGKSREIKTNSWIELNLAI